VKRGSPAHLAGKLERQAKSLGAACLREARQVQALESEVAAAAQASRLLFRSAAPWSSIQCAASEWHLRRAALATHALRGREAEAIVAAKRALQEQRHWGRLRCGLERRLRRKSAQRSRSA